MDEQTNDDVLNRLSEQEDASNKPERMRLSPKKISMQNFDVSPQTVYKHLFGADAYVDERTGELMTAKANVFSSDKTPENS